MDLEWNFATAADRDNATDNAAYTADGSRCTSNQVNFFDSTSNNLWITGVQLEVGDTATPFEHRSYGYELARCQRYYLKTNAYHQMYQADGGNISNGSFVSFPVEMRANPTISFTNVAATKTDSSYANGVGKGGFLLSS